MPYKVAVNLDMSGNQIVNALLQILSSDPGSPAEGLFWYNSVGDVIKYRDGSATQIVASQAWVSSQIAGAGGGDMLAATYDPTSVEGDAFAMDNMVEGTDTKIMTAAERTKLSGVATGADVTNATNVANAGAVMDTDFGTNGLMKRTGAGAYAIIADNSTNWNTAYGWGNHAGAGYLTSVSLSGITDWPGTVSATEVGYLNGVTSGIQGQIDSKAATSHTHTASQITDFATAVQAQIIAYWDTIANTDADIDTIRELMDLVLSNESGLNNIIGRHNADIGNGSSTSIAVTHSLNSLDVSVEVFEKSTGATVLCDITRTSADVVTLGFATAPTTNQYRVVIKK
ncbi:MAG: hypothetical protein CMJ42_22740 [Phyllobacteriaceae bacterium]|nr:hypothetical protein [Phyllobacteriaceae bacterium]